jgi:predicted HicB family RNase H-like nuclease
MDINTQSTRKRQEEVIKVAAPRQLKKELVSAATSRNISLSALVRIALTEYIKNKK